MRAGQRYGGTEDIMSFVKMFGSLSFKFFRFSRDGETALLAFKFIFVQMLVQHCFKGGDDGEKAGKDKDNRYEVNFR